MKRILLVIVFLSLNCFSQEVEDSDLPNITPPSPEASSLTKFGDLPVNEFNGMVNLNIPLYTYKSGKLELPIGLTYNGLGVTVDELPSWVGINWVLNAGGVITRTVNDLPDEKSLSRIDVNYIENLLSEIDIYTLNPTTEDYDDAWTFSNVVKGNNQVDKEPDLFNFNFSGYSGSFYLNENYEPVFSKLDKNLKIEIIGDQSDLKNSLRTSNEFCITTPEGVKYYFGGNQAIEYSHLTSSSGGTWLSQTLISPTAYYLKMIVHPINGSIMFEYFNVNSQKVLNLSKTQSLGVYDIVQGDQQLGYGECYPIHSFPEGLQTSMVCNRIIDAKYLKRIYSLDNNEEVVFNFNIASNHNYIAVLNSINILKNSQEKLKINLEYIYNGLSLLNSDRFFLNKVRFNQEINDSNFSGRKKNDVYEMIYDDPLSIPERFSYVQDLMGFYNGKFQNQSFIPKIPNTLFENFGLGANRYSNFEFAKKGVLKKVIYPSGGWTEFDYEPLYAKDFDYDGVNLKIWRNRPDLIPNEKLFDTFTGEFFEDGTSSLFVSFQDQELKGTLHVEAEGNMGHTDKIYVKLVDLTDVNNIYEELLNFVMPYPQNPVNYTKEFYFNLLEGHIYKVDIYSEYESNFESIPMKANLSLKFIKGYKKIEDFGFRLKSTKDYFNDYEFTNHKRYYYCKLSEVNVYNNLSGLKLFTLPFPIKDDCDVKCCVLADENGIVTSPDLDRVVLTGKVFSTNIFPLFKWIKPNEYVTISLGGDNFENGGVEKKFMYSEQPSGFVVKPNDDFEIIGTNLEMKKGNIFNFKQGHILRESIFEKRDNNLFKMSQVEYKYKLTYTNENSVTGFQGENKGGICGANSPYTIILPIKINGYSFHSVKFEPESTKNINYFGGVPLADHLINESNYNKLINTTDFLYGDVVGAPIEIRTTNSYGELKVIKNTYSNDFSELNNLNTNDVSCYTTLFLKNIVDKPIQIVEKVNNEILSKTRITYDYWGNSNYVLPNFIWNAKGGNELEKKVEYKEYDLNGNISLVSKNGGMNTKFFYNGNSQVYLKIENYENLNNNGSGEFEEFDESEINSETNQIEFCAFGQSHPNSLMTAFFYDSISNQITKTMDSNCNKIFYEYDELYKLKFIRDNEGNILKEFDMGYKN